jgi:vibriolysin
VHYSSSFCNAFWSGSQMVYGDGNPAQNCSNLAVAQDVTAHELTHGVTQNESGLVYSGESGGMNEAMSDIFGAFVEAWRDGGKTGTNLAVSANTWLIGELVIPPALRWMCDPAHDGQSADLYSSTVGNLDPHYSSGLGNLAFCLLSQGGPHPRGKTTITTTGIGMDKAIRIMYEAQTNILTSTATFATVRTAMEQAATNLGYDQATKDSVSCAWAEIGVGAAPTNCGGGGSDGTLTNNVPATGINGATGSQQFWKLDVPTNQTTLTFTISGGTGDADLYVQSGAKPTLTSYACRPHKAGNVETCSFTPPAAGTYWVMLNGSAAYAGVSLVGKYSSSGGDGVTVLSNGVAVMGISGASSSSAYWKVQTPAGASLTVQISGGTGDADLYTKFNAKPTTSSYDCRPYVSGNNESCKVTSTQAGYYYVRVRGYQAYSGVSLVASW